MCRFIIFISFLIVYSPIITNGEKFIVVIPTRQIRRSPTILPVSRPNLRATSYLKLAPFGPYGPMRPALLPAGNHQLDLEQGGPDVANYAVLPYGKGVNYATYARGYLPHDRLKGGLVPLINQNNRYPIEVNRLRVQQAGPSYGPPPATYYQRPTDAVDPYHTDKSTPTKLQPIDRPPVRPNFADHQYSTVQQPRPEDHPPPTSQKSPQPAASTNYPKLGPIIVKGPTSINRPESSQQIGSDLLKQSSNAVTKIPAPSAAVGVGKGEFVIRDTLMLDDYEKKIADFTKSWPKLSAFPSAFGSASSFWPGASGSFGQTLSSGVSRNSDLSDSSNSIGRQGYEVKEEIDEPPFDFRTMPIITNPAFVYPTPTASSLYRNVFG